MTIPQRKDKKAEVMIAENYESVSRSFAKLKRNKA